MRKVFVSTLLATGLLPLLAGLALAGAGVKALLVSSSTNRADAGAVFPFGTEEVYVIFDYEGAANEKIAVILEGAGLTELYRSATKTYRGDGSDTVTISGAAVYVELTGRLADEASQVQGAVTKVKSSSQGIQEYLLQIDGHLTAVESALSLVETLGDGGALGSSAIGQAGELRVAVERMAQLVHDAIYLPADDVAGKKALAGQMESPAQVAVDTAEALEDHASTVAAIMLPATGTDQEGFTIQVEVNGYPAISASFAVFGDAPSGDGRASPTTTGSSSSVVVLPTRTSGSGSAGGDGGRNQGAASLATATRAAVTRATATSRSANLGAATVTAVGGSVVALSGATAVPAEPGAAEEAQDQAPVGQPTWTVPAGTVVADAGQGLGETRMADPGAGAAGGPNMPVLAGGLVVLAAMAFWLWRRI